MPVLYSLPEQIYNSVEKNVGDELAILKNINSPERGVLLLDKNYRIHSANKRMAEIFGTSVDVLIGSELPEIITNRSMNDSGIIEEVIEGLIEQGTVFHRYSTPVMSSDGAVTGRIEIYSDITARRELEKEILDRNAELAELNKQLEEAQDQLVHSERLRTLGEMAAGVAHDINNVLGIIIGNAQLAKRKIKDDNNLSQCVNAIELAAKDAAETVRRLREIGKPIDSSVYQLIDLSDIAEDVVKSVFPLWNESGLKSDSDINIELHTEKDCKVVGNATELREALSNILLNAAQAIENNGNIIVSTKREAEYSELIVSDNGIGMNEETKSRLFDPFFTTRGADGTGLGMSMVDAIAIRHHGKVFVESEEGKGTKITIRLPVRG